MNIFNNVDGHTKESNGIKYLICFYRYKQRNIK